MHFKKVERLKELAFALNTVSAEMIALFAANDAEEAENEREQKKIPKAASSPFRDEASTIREERKKKANRRQQMNFGEITTRRFLA